MRNYDALGRHPPQPAEPVASGALTQVIATGAVRRHRRGWAGADAPRRRTGDGNIQRPGGYSATQIALHWIVALLVLGQYVFKERISLTWGAHRAGEAVSFDPLVAAHVAGGGLILVLVVWRLTLRLGRGTPSPHANEPVSLVRVSEIAHWAF
jgi:hypothetical protein